MNLVLLGLSWLKKQPNQSFQLLLRLIGRYKVLAFSIAGIFIVLFFAALLSPTSVKIYFFNTYLKDFFDETVSSNQSLFPFILSNNLRVLLINFLLSFTIIIPLLVYAFNAYFIAFFAEAMDKLFGLIVSSGPNPLIPFLIVGMLPHGIIEIPTFFLSAFLSTLLGLKLILGKRIIKEETRVSFLTQVFKIYLFIFVPLIFIAAVIESTVSAKLGSIAISEVNLSQSQNILPSSLVIETADLQNLGVKAQARNVPSDDLLNGNKWGELGTLLYNQIYYQSYIQNKPDGLIEKAYLLNNNSTSTIRVLHFDTELKANNFFKLEERILDQSTSQYQFKKVTPNRYQNIDSVNADTANLIDIYKIGSYVVIISYWGKDTKLIEMIDQLEIQKIQSST